MNKPFTLRPMLGAKLKEGQDLQDLQYPLYASPKIDGIRALVVDGRLYSRTLTLIPNQFVQEFFAGLPEGFDGELAVGEPWHPNLMQRTMSGVMSFEGTPVVNYYVFDTYLYTKRPFWRRLEWLQGQVSTRNFPGVRLVQQTLIHTHEELKEYENTQLRLGYEGVIVRTVTSPYKYGRSTLREGYLVKLKRYQDAEARVVGFEELEINLNDQERDELGYAKRSHHRAGKVPGGVLGALLCVDLETGQPVRLGSGFTAAERKDIWAAREKYVGLCVTYKHFAVTGVKEGRRQPIFKCFRDLRDIGSF